MMACLYLVNTVFELIVITSIVVTAINLILYPLACPYSNSHPYPESDTASHTPHNTHHPYTHSIHNFITSSYYPISRHLSSTRSYSNKTYP